MEIFACAPSLISKVAMLCCLVCMWHCYVVDSMSLSAAKKQHGIANLLIKIAAEIIMEIFACAPSLISKIAMLCCLVGMWHCYIVD